MRPRRSALWRALSCALGRAQACALSCVLSCTVGLGLAAPAGAAPPGHAPGSGGPGAPSTPAAAPAAAKPFGCLIEPDRVADVGSQVVGVVEQLRVERGDTVAAGQVLLTMHADVERANAGVADTRSRHDADVLAAQASLTLADQKLARAKALLAESFVSEQAVEQARTEQELARQRVAQARSQQRIWEDERRVAEAQLALRTLRSPFAGVVTERFVNVGERVEERPLLRVAVIDPLRVELMVPTSLFGAIAPGSRIRIQPELPGADAVLATVRDVDRVLDAASNSFRVRLALANPQHRLPAGLRCKADLPAPGTVAAAPVAVPVAAVAPPPLRRAP